MLLREPWSFDKHLVVFQGYDGKSPLEELDFNFSKFWVQIHYLPFHLLTPEVALVIGETLGIVISSKDTLEMIGGNFMHVRVAIDITLLLCKGRKVAFDDGLVGWIAFKY